MTNTSKRILSAAVLILILIAGFFVGPVSFILMAYLIGAIPNLEFHLNFCKNKLLSPRHLIGQFILFLLFFLVVKGTFPFEFSIKLNYLACFLHFIFFLVIVLPFKVIPLLSTLSTHFSFLSGIYFLLPLNAFYCILASPQWASFLGLLLILNYGMDTGAWFFGKKWGKRPFFPTISPHKTIEGFLGGVLASMLLGGLFWSSLSKPLTPTIILLFAFLGGLSQFGDLWESKLKRHFSLKDSSELIPGHGGVYDRVDSLLFLVPFYLWMMTPFFL